MEKYVDVIIIISFLLGGLIAWFLSLKSSKYLKMNNEELLERLKLDEIQVAELKRICQKVEVEKAELDTELRLNNQKIKELEKYRTQLEQANNQIQQIEKDKVRLEENYRSEKEKLQAIQDNFGKQKEQLKNEFRVVVNEILESNSNKFTEQSKKNIGAMAKKTIPQNYLKSDEDE
jgi:biopolymer transport protein ExbB/TolQ